MDFTFSEDQLLFRQSVHDFLVREVTPARIRELWHSDSGHSDSLWGQLTEMGLTGMTVPEAHGGLGMKAPDFVLLARECGYVALPGPLVHTALVAVPLLEDLGGDIAAAWLPQIAAGTARVLVGLEENRFVEDAHIADLLILQKGAALYAVDPADTTMRANPSVDPSRKLFALEFDEAAAEKITDAAGLIRVCLDRGALGAAAQALGLAQRMLDSSVQYTAGRQQFGKPVGSFQAVKHHLANVAVALEYAGAPVYRAAWALAQGLSTAALNVSQAKLSACAAAGLAAANCMQVHGAMGYTWEVDLHIFMKKAWALANSWGDAGFHKSRVAHTIFAEGAALGAGNTFPD